MSAAAPFCTQVFPDLMDFMCYGKNNETLHQENYLVITWCWKHTEQARRLQATLEGRQPKLWLTHSLTHSLTGVKCRVTSVAKKYINSGVWKIKPELIKSSWNDLACVSIYIFETNCKKNQMILHVFQYIFFKRIVKKIKWSCMCLTIYFLNKL